MIRVVIIFGLVLLVALCWCVCAVSDFDEDERDCSGLLEEDE